MSILKAVVRRRILVVALVLLGAVAGFLIGPPKDREPETIWDASHTLIATESGSSTTRLALFARRTDVAGPIAATYGYESVADLLGDVGIDANDELSTIEFATSQPTARNAAGVVDDFAAALVGVLVDEANQEREQDLVAIRAEILRLESDLAPLSDRVDRGIATLSEQTEHSALLSLYGAKLGEQRALQEPADAPLRTLNAVDPRAREVGGFSTPLSGWSMALIGGLLGLGLAVGLALALDQLDSRAQTTKDVLDAFKVPILGQVPTLPRSYRGGFGVVTRDEPNSAVSEAYRSLRTRLSAYAKSVQRIDFADERLPSVIGTSDRPTGKAFLVTSAGLGDGKSTSVANLAAAFADAGNDVIVFSGDLRSPSVHRHLGVAEDVPGLGDTDLELATIAEIEDVLEDTALTNVRLLAHGSLVNNPGELLASRLPVLRATKEIADIVLVDAPPVLAANDVPELLPAVDGVLLTARLGQTRVPAAKESARLLESLGAPVVGVAVLEAAGGDAAIYGYYGVGRGPGGDVVRGHARISRSSSTAVEARTGEPYLDELDEVDDVDEADDVIEIDEDDIDVPIADGVGATDESDAIAGPSAAGNWSAWRTR